MPVKVAVVGCGWWSQGWHLPQLDRHPDVELVAIVDTAAHPQSSLANPALEPLTVLAAKYKCRAYDSLEALLGEQQQQQEGGGEGSPPPDNNNIDGLLIATPHATHYQLGVLALQASARRMQQEVEAAAAAASATALSTPTDNADFNSNTAPTYFSKPIHILMEKPMTTDVEQAAALFEAVQQYQQRQQQQLGEKGTFLINHSANYRPQTVKARNIVTSGRIGEIRHITAFMASPLSWIFEDPKQTGWNQPTGNMKGKLLLLSNENKCLFVLFFLSVVLIVALYIYINHAGNGFAWGQSSHLLAWIFHVCPDLQPNSVFCSMTHSPTTGADVAHAATVTCSNGAVLSISGTSLLPGNAHSDPPVGKRLRLEIYGTTGALIYNGVDTDPDSGKLKVIDTEGKSEVVYDSFAFEDLEQQGTGPASLQSWIDACHGNKRGYYEGADCELGLKTVQVLSAMYESHETSRPALIQHTNKTL